MDWRWLLRDWGGAIMAVGLDTVFFTGLSQEADQVGWAGPQPDLTFVLAGAPAVPVLAMRRRAPVLVCLVLAGWAVTLTIVVGSRPIITLLVALYAAAVARPRGISVICLMAVLAAHVVAVWYEASFPNVTAGDVALVALVYCLLDCTTWAAARWGAGAAARARESALEASRARLVREAVFDERVRIARELHDIVTHAVTTMTIQAAGARRWVLNDPRRAVQALESVQGLGQQSIAELRRLLAVLHARDGSSEEPNVGHTVKEIPDLVQTMRGSGIVVAFETQGREVQLDPSVSLALYRVAQETLTNAARHASGAQVRLQLSWQVDSVHLTVSNNLTDARSTLPSAGFGLAGLGERVRLLGGSFVAGRSIDDRFVVESSLPTPQIARSIDLS